MRLKMIQDTVEIIIPFIYDTMYDGEYIIQVNIQVFPIILENIFEYFTT